MSSIRRSSLISITLGLSTVIGGYLSFASLEETAGHASNPHLSLYSRTYEWRGQALIIVEVEARGLPASAATKPQGGRGVLPYLPPK
jgi:hypothetical protein